MEGDRRPMLLASAESSGDASASSPVRALRMPTARGWTVKAIEIVAETVSLPAVFLRRTPSGPRGTPTLTGSVVGSPQAEPTPFE